MPDDPDMRVKHVWDDLPESQYLRKIGEFYYICTKALQKSTPIQHARSYLAKWESAYGQRIREVDTETGIDWKSLSHAVRIAHELRELLTDGQLTFPRANAVFLKDIKDGKIPFDVVGSALKGLMEECDQLIETSDLPDRVCKQLVDEVILDIMLPITEDYVG
jgi:hypothetical protein